ncbi:MAG TPA: hypothetical protein VI653_07095 [Steroidobacteraceae bacterium]
MNKNGAVSGNSEFLLDWEMRPCLVTRDLLSQIERQLELQKNDLLGGSTNLERQYEIAVLDEFGTEAFYAARDIPLNG